MQPGLLLHASDCNGGVNRFQRRLLATKQRQHFPVQLLVRRQRGLCRNSIDVRDLDSAIKQRPRLGLDAPQRRDLQRLVTDRVDLRGVKAQRVLHERQFAFQQCAEHRVLVQHGLVARRPGGGILENIAQHPLNRIDRHTPAFFPRALGAGLGNPCEVLAGRGIDDRLGDLVGVVVNIAQRFFAVSLCCNAETFRVFGESIVIFGQLLAGLRSQLAQKPLLQQLVVLLGIDGWELGTAYPGRRDQVAALIPLQFSVTRIRGGLSYPAATQPLKGKLRDLAGQHADPARHLALANVAIEHPDPRNPLPRLNTPAGHYSSPPRTRVHLR